MVDPSPDWIATILIGSAAKAPTISNSGLLGANPSGFVGNLSAGGITLVAADFNFFFAASCF